MLERKVERLALCNHSPGRAGRTVKSIICFRSVPQAHMAQLLHIIMSVLKSCKSLSAVSWALEYVGGRWERFSVETVQAEVWVPGKAAICDARHRHVSWILFLLSLGKDKIRSESV